MHGIDDQNVDDQDRKPWYAHLPAKLAAVVVFLVAVTTLVGNVFELVDERVPPVVPEAAPPTQPPTAEAAPSGPVDLHLDRIVVQHDGSPGTTDWRFSIEVDGEPMLAFQQEALDDTEGRNVAVPDEPGARVRNIGDRNARVVVKGWRGSWFKFGSAPDATGEGWLTPSGGIGTIRVAAKDAESGAFVFHFSTTR